MPSSKAVSTCLVCKKRPKRKAYQFCSKRCTNIAAKKAPQLLRVPKNHVMYKDVAKSFRSTWNSNASRPTIARMYLITWTEKLRSSFDNYRANVANKLKRGKKLKEVKRFRSEARMCRLGDPGKSTKLCKRQQCHLCRAIATGFMSTLSYKRALVIMGNLRRTRFGGGVYMAPASSTAFQYADNCNTGSRYKAVLSTRAVLGNPQKVVSNDRLRLWPNPGYDSLEAHPPDGGPAELVVYNYNSVRPAYLLILK
ncbi:uncharacterized protein EV420DRAFT_426018 [Desarmillaria tabescens]|uniref:PARP catalytic domain-containing protein n=1 Tax=Armillaria tabescens TaxID=1929756 RepID=A0AA39TZW7_ARMTA|nr:uncharacterized protein EV420DRAFT_426018 [Desarmillaria tabescens]KAK0467744.1 hypothetical protein EV420DRAFT_426018 [Desarmillaria tabescens]